MTQPQRAKPARTAKVRRKLPIGAELQQGGGAHFRVWAPAHDTVTLRLTESGRTIALEKESGGYFSQLVDEVAAGARYQFLLGDDGPFPDPASRYQPDGPHGPSVVVDAAAFVWSDSHWRGLERTGQVLYELHVGTFTPEGTWRAASTRLPELAELGITTIEMMPVADFPGRFGWGYDGVALFAPARLYGTPDDLRNFIDHAHAFGIGVILDVVYNHIGPDGNYLEKFSKDYFTSRYKNEWGEAINFDGRNCGPVREFFISNAAYWVSEFHLDGLRIDATQQMFDASRPNILKQIVDAVHHAGEGRNVYVVAENEPQHVTLLTEHHTDALWNDDFHHTARVALVGRREAYYTDYCGTAQEFVSAAKYGFLYQGQRYSWQQKRRGTPTRGLSAERFIHYLENHDQIANSPDGKRLHQISDPGRLRSLTALLLLGPQTPLLFQGQEFASSKPFLYFADHHEELAKAVRQGRVEFLTQFSSIKDPEVRKRLPKPDDVATFERCKLDHSEMEEHAHWYALHRDLIRLRMTDLVFCDVPALAVDGAVLGNEVFALRYFGATSDRLLLVNLGSELRLPVMPEPLLAPPRHARWHLLWSSEDPDYGGAGNAAVESEDGWCLPAHSAVVLQPILRAHDNES